MTSRIGKKIVVVGGGPMGSSVALHLAKLLGPSTTTTITVIERDRSYKMASAMLSAGGIRQQFSLKENIQLSQYSVQFLKQVVAEVNQAATTTGDMSLPHPHFREHGYLFLGSKQEHNDILLANHQQQRECGVTSIDILSQSQLQKEFPWMNCDDLTLGSLGRSNEGFFDPWALVQHMKSKAIELGVKYVDGEAVGGNVVGNGASQVTIKSVAVRSSSTGIVNNIDADTVVNCAGAWSGIFQQQLQQQVPDSIFIKFPVQPRKRLIFHFHCAPLTKASSTTTTTTTTTTTEEGKQWLVPPPTTPLVVDPSGLYFRPEGNNNRFICGMSPSEQDDIDCVGVADELRVTRSDEELFEEVLWPLLLQRVPSFESLKVSSSWAGFYDYNTFDQNAIIGKHDNFSNLFLCTGFSGHGLQQSPAAGLATAECIVFGTNTTTTTTTTRPTVDVSRMSLNRVERNQPLFETGIV